VTRILQQYFGLNGKMTLLTFIDNSIASRNDYEILSSLRFAKRSKDVVNRPKMNIEKKMN
jgi:hypothetical protein